MKKTVMYRMGDSVRTGDMVLMDSTPHLVWEWRGDQPAVTSPLNPQHLQTDPAHLPPGIDAVYGQDVEDPRAMH